MTTDPTLSEEFAPIPKWPKPVGIISICWGALGLLCNGCGLANVAFSSTFMKGAEEALKAPMPDVMKPTPIQAIPMVFGLVWTILLLVAGIMLIGRKQASIMAHLVYGIGGLLLSVIGVAIGGKQQLAIQAWAQANAGDPWAKQYHPLINWSIFAAASLLFFAWPVFCVAWFSAKRKADLGGTAMSEIV